MENLDAKKCAACPLGPPDWVYQCGDCGAQFKMPAPRGPTEEKNRACPRCGAKNIKRTDAVKSEACPPGG